MLLVVVYRSQLAKVVGAYNALKDPESTEEEKAARQAFEDEVLDRLFALNAERAAEERRVGGKRS